MVYGWGYSSWNCNWGGGAVFYHGGAYYGNSAWHGGYYGGGYNYNNSYRNNIYNNYQHNNYNSGNRTNISGNTININRGAAINRGAVGSGSSDQWKQIGRLGTVPRPPTAGDRQVPVEAQRRLVEPAPAGNPGSPARVAGEAAAVAADGAPGAVAGFGGGGFSRGGSAGRRW